MKKIPSLVRLLALPIVLLLQACGSPMRQSPGSADAVGVSSQAVVSGQSIHCGFTADVLRITRVVYPSGRSRAVDFKTYGYLIDPDPQWEVELDVLLHDGKTPFQPGRRVCYIADVESVFGVPSSQVTGSYTFSFAWNVEVPGMPEFENFKASKK